MKMLSFFLALLLLMPVALPASADTHVIASLGNAPVLGELDSTASLKVNVLRNERLFAAAGKQLGLSDSEYSRLLERVASSHLSYVIIPRHLDAMTWAANGRVRVLNDVQIPAKTHGWEIDLRENGQLLALFIPAKCGNLSILRRHLPVLAMAEHKKPAHIAAIPTPPVATAQPSASPPPSVATPAPAFTPQLNALESAVTAAPTHHANFLLPILGLLAVGLLAGNHGNSPTFTGAPPLLPSAGCPKPKSAH